MISNIQSFDTAAYPNIKGQILHWINRFSICSFLDNHEYLQQTPGIECLAAAGAVCIIENNLQEVNTHIAQKKGWLFGHLNYEWQSTTSDPIGFTPFRFFQPETVLQLSDTGLSIHTIHNDPRKIFEEIVHTKIPITSVAPVIQIQQSINRDTYIDTIKRIQAHIQRGDCYELNFCMEFFANDVTCSGVNLYTSLSELSPVPFACFYKQENAVLICASPERYLQKKGDNLLSQPIKGTIQRNIQDAANDLRLKETLQNSSKDQSENVMVVDMVRNDLSKVCKEGTVAVAELFGVYSFPQVHQMISSITGILKEDMQFSDIITATYPMGSMTGAPKQKVMELVQQYEKQARGLFSGAVGYINPSGDFDFNVVIRSLFYNHETKKLRYLAGSGITIYSDPAKEYEECLLKAKALSKVLGN